uniref:CRISPR type III A-associated protein Csm2 n=1 Tax=Thermodesulfobacterium geofontis TaxID=1295609 RepID=A0A7C4JQU6_9BACT
MGKSEYEFYSIKPWELRQLRDLTKDVFSNIGTEKSRQRLVYDLLNALKTNDRKRFLWLILKNVNNISVEKSEKVKRFAEFLSTLQFEHETAENFDKIAYAIVMGIMSVESEKGGGSNE